MFRFDLFQMHLRSAKRRALSLLGLQRWRTPVERHRINVAGTTRLTTNGVTTKTTRSMTTKWTTKTRRRRMTLTSMMTSTSVKRRQIQTKKSIKSTSIRRHEISRAFFRSVLFFLTKKRLERRIDWSMKKRKMKSPYLQPCINRHLGSRHFSTQV